jgi:protein phosphatase
MTDYLLYPALSTHRGRRRDLNEDAVAFMIPSDPAALRTYGAMFLVADGVGGVEHGERASDRALRVLLHDYYQGDAPDDVAARLVELVQQANTLLHATPEQGATTLVAAVLRGETLTVASVGDSAAFWLSANQCQKLTEDHVAVIDPANPKKRRLTRALGHQPTLSVDTITGTITRGARLALVSDGVTRHLDENRLRDLCTGGPPADSVRAVIQAANDAGGTDNISIILVEIGPPGDDDLLREHVQAMGDIFVTVPEPRAAPPVPASPPPAPPAPIPAAPSEPVARPAPPVTPAPPSKRRPARLGLLLAGLIVAAVLGFWLMSQGGDSPSSPTAPADRPADTAAPADSPPTVDPLNAPLVVGARVRFATSAITYTQIGRDVAAFVLDPSRTYSVRDSYTGRDGVTWYQLYDSESEHYGWIALPDLPDYRLD